MEEGLELFEVFLTFENDDIKSLYSNICKPRVLIPNPSFDATVDNPVPANILSPFIRIPEICKARLDQLVYGGNIYCGVNIETTRQILPFHWEFFGTIKMLEDFNTLLEENIGVNRMALASFINNYKLPTYIPGKYHGAPWSDYHWSIMECLA